MCAGGEAGDESGGPGPALPAAGLGRLTTPARGKRVEAPTSRPWLVAPMLSRRPRTVPSTGIALVRGP